MISLAQIDEGKRLRPATSWKKRYREKKIKKFSGEIFDVASATARKGDRQG
ncbi:hypothetical protein [Brenneria roseae]|uniref:hypothetical protein n=1 Tax=Brenneria roseae TaxID=1509241 RepID=UPI001445CEBC|nr:hypothetical protein [Brenneria roseae]